MGGVRIPTSSARPRMVIPLSVEQTKPRLICYERKLHSFTKQTPFSIQTVARVDAVAPEGCYMTSLGDSSAFHQILLRPSSWMLF